jgi:hypothetical protein
MPIQKAFPPGNARRLSCTRWKPPASIVARRLAGSIIVKPALRVCIDANWLLPTPGAASLGSCNTTESNRHHPQDSTHYPGTARSRRVRTPAPRAPVAPVHSHPPAQRYPHMPAPIQSQHLPIASLHGIQISRVESIPTTLRVTRLSMRSSPLPPGDSDHRDRLRPTVRQCFCKQLRERRQLRDADRIHVAFVIGKRHVEPRIYHELI